MYLGLLGIHLLSTREIRKFYHWLWSVSPRLSLDVHMALGGQWLHIHFSSNPHPHKEPDTGLGRFGFFLSASLVTTLVNMSSTPVVHTPATEHHAAVTTTPVNEEKSQDLLSEKKNRSSSSLHSNKAPITDPLVLAAREEEDIQAHRRAREERYRKFRPFILGALALLILGWWISATVLPATRHRWCVTYRYTGTLLTIF